MLYQMHNASVAFSGENVLCDVDFEIRNTEKIAVVGRNGCGKTTLLRLIDGEIEPEREEGNEPVVATSGNPQIGYLRQIAFSDTSISLEDEIKKAYAPMLKRKDELEAAAKALETEYSEAAVEKYTAMEESFAADGGYYFEKECDVLIKKFGFSEEERKKPLSDFSGGQQTKIAFIKLLLSKPDILLLDEPTNHLDITTVEWLEYYLKNYPKAVVVVSHDRMFLDNIVDVVYEIEYGSATRYVGNYTAFIKIKQQNYEKLQKDYQAQQKEIARLQRMVDRFKGKPTKTAMAHSKEKAIERMEKIEAPVRFDVKTFHADFTPQQDTGNDVLDVTDLSIGWDKVISTLNFSVKRGEKLGILGGNGLGKSTLLKTLVDEIPPLGGQFRYGVHVQIGYFDQQMAMYSSEKTVLADFWDEFPQLTETQARSSLGAFLFSGDDVFKQIDMLSGGEKVRLALCKILKRRPNVLILDEPTNHMDIVGKETLEEMLSDYAGTIIFVTHDRYFVKQVATRLLVFEDGTVNEYQFGYEQYQEKLSLKAQAESYKNAPEALGGKISLNGDAENEKKDAPEAKPAARKGGGNTVGRERTRLERKIKKVEDELAEKEEILNGHKQELLNPAYQSSYSKLTEIQAAIDEAEAEVLSSMAEWEALSTQLEELEKSIEEA
ncbi:MAG: ABC-F type ribosomal protection protein [Clostridiales bacterium]|nr:ABC-F type ribosomal protection protein [Clostridiales bacterium]